MLSYVCRRAKFFSKLAVFLAGFALGTSSLLIGVICFVLAVLFDVLSGVAEGKLNSPIDKL